MSVQDHLSFEFMAVAWSVLLLLSEDYDIDKHCR